MFKTLVEVCQNDGLDPSVVVWLDAGILMCFRASPLQERAADIARQLGDSHWTTTCVVTIGRFNSFFSDQEDAHAALCFLTQSGKARYLVARKQDRIEVCSLFVVHSIARLKHVLCCDSVGCMPAGCQGCTQLCASSCCIKA